MSLNRTEQMTFDYLEENHDEYHFWKEKVVSVAKAVNSDHEAARRLEEELWAYVLERSAVVNPFRDVAQSEGLPRTSMRNLAEYILRLWTVPRKKPKKALS